MGKSYKKQRGGIWPFGDSTVPNTVPNSGPSYWQQLTGSSSNPRPGFNQQGQQQPGFYQQEPVQQPRPGFYQQGQQGQQGQQRPGQRQRFAGGSNAASNAALVDAKYMLNGGRRTRKNKTRRGKSRRVKSRRGKSRRGKSRRR